MGMSCVTGHEGDSSPGPTPTLDLQSTHFHHHQTDDFKLDSDLAAGDSALHNFLMVHGSEQSAEDIEVMVLRSAYRPPKEDLSIPPKPKPVNLSALGLGLSSGPSSPTGESKMIIASETIWDF